MFKMKAVNIILAAAMFLGNAPASWALKEKRTRNMPDKSEEIKNELGGRKSPLEGPGSPYREQGPDIRMPSAWGIADNAIVRALENGLLPYLDEQKTKGYITDEELELALAGIKYWLTRKGYPPKSVAKLRQLILAEDWERITLDFYRKLKFGTAGERGEQVDNNGDVLPGPNAINDYTIAEYALGLARYLLKTGQEARGVAIGGDTRIKSVFPYRDETSYTELQAKILRRLGIKVYRFIEPRSIAQVALALVKSDAASMMYNSASHNKWQDNGVKASNEFSAQLFPDERERILAEITKVTPEDIAVLDLDNFDLERDHHANPDMHILLGGRDSRQPVDVDSDAEYIKVNQSFVSALDIVRDYSDKVHSFFTPIQGAGIYTIPKILNDGKDFKFNVSIYEAQAYQDAEGRFHTVEKPDPNYINKDTGTRTLDKAIEEAERLEKEKSVIFDFVFGTDPDADRTSFAVRDREGKWQVLKANDAWSLYAWYILNQRRPEMPKEGFTVIKTWATTDLIKEIAQDPKFGLRVFEPAVGFNKIAEIALKEIALPEIAKRRSVDLNALYQLKPLTLDGLAKIIGADSRQAVIQEINSILKEFLLFGAEESNGISPGGHTLEKDGAVAAVIFHEIAAFVKYINEHKKDFSAKDPYLKTYFEEFQDKDMTPYELLNRVYLEYSYHATENIPLEFEGLHGDTQKKDIIDDIVQLADLVNERRETPEAVRIAAREVKNAVSGSEYTSTDYVQFQEVGYKFTFSDGNWILIRPSGTESYIRFYGDLRWDKSELNWQNIEDKKKEADNIVRDVVLKTQNLFILRQMAKEFYAPVGERGRFENLFKDAEAERGGWVHRLKEVLASDWPEIMEEAAEELRAQDKGMGVIGMGGEVSVLGLSGKRLVKIDSTAPAKWRRLVSDEVLKKMHWFNISKSGATKETNENANYLIERFVHLGLNPIDGISYVTDPGTPFAKKQDDGFSVRNREWKGKDSIGGRNTLFNLLPLLEVALLHPGQLRLMLERVDKAHTFANAQDDPWIRAAIDAMPLIRNNRQKVALIQPEWMRKEKWNWQWQSAEESLGKGNRGFTLYTSRQDLNVLRRNKDKKWVFVEFRIKGREQETEEYAKQAAADGHPVITILVDESNPSLAMPIATFGWMKFVAFVGALWDEEGINFSDQPAVEEYKKLMKARELKLADAIEPAQAKDAVVNDDNFTLVYDGLLSYLTEEQKTELKNLQKLNVTLAAIYAKILQFTQGKLDTQTLAYYDDVAPDTEQWLEEEITQKILHRDMGYAAKWGEGTGLLHGPYTNLYSGPVHQIPLHIVAQNHIQPSELAYPKGAQVLKEGAVAAHLSLVTAERPSAMLILKDKLDDTGRKTLQHFFEEVKVMYADNRVANAVPGFREFLAKHKLSRGALVIGANAIFENSGAVSSLRALKETQSNVKIVVWAKDEADVQRLKMMGIEPIVDRVVDRIVVLQKLTYRAFLGMLNNIGKDFQLMPNEMVLVNSVQDISEKKGTISKAMMRLSGYARININTPNITSANQAQINFIPLVLANAITQLSPQELKARYEEFLESNLKIIREEEQEKFRNALSVDIYKKGITVPLVTTTDAQIIEAQKIYATQK